VNAFSPKAVAARLGPQLMGASDSACSTDIAVGVGLKDKRVQLEGFERNLRPAGVLVPLVAHEDGVTVLLTQRADHLPDHPGEVSFPGGAVEPCDQDAVAAALREAEEEVGMPQSHVTILGALEQRATISDYRVTPVVGLVTQFTPRLQADEVADVFEVPLSFIFDKSNHELRDRSPTNQKRREFYAIPYGERFIWGFTARILVRLSELWIIGKKDG
jgi:8-oxo-dGTP pyrophosphatase MutT (NUDIX family)